MDIYLSSQFAVNNLFNQTIYRKDYIQRKMVQIDSKLIFNFEMNIKSFLDL